MKKKLPTLQEPYYLDKIIALMPGTVYWKDSKGYYRGCNNNAAIVSGAGTRENFINKTIYDLVGNDLKELADKTNAIDEKVLKTSVEYLVEEEGLDLEGNPAFYLTRKVPIPNEDGKTIGMLGISLDITERKRLEKNLQEAKEAAEAASHAKTDFIANMSHDIRTPLVGIIGLSEELQNEIINDESKEKVILVQNCAEQLLLLLNNVLEMLSDDHPFKTSHAFETVCLRDSLEHIQQLLSPSAMVKDLEFVVEWDPAIPAYVKSDRVKMERILLNLLSNAIKFTEEGRITVKVELLSQQDGRCELRWQVRDTGAGIEPEHLPHIFDQFFKASPSYRHATQQGFGMGLYIVKRFIEQLGGTIRVESQVKEGSLFEFLTPLEIAKAPPLQSKIQALPKESKTALCEKTYRILLVEDSKIVSMTMMKMLHRLCCEVDLAETGEAALYLASTQDYDLIFMDIGLPDKEGTEVAYLIRQVEKAKGKRHTIIIGLSAHVDGKIHDQCLLRGMNEAITKPLKQKVCESLLNEWLGARAQHQDQAKTEFLESYPLIDEVQLLDSISGDREVAREILCLLIEESLPQEHIALEKAYQEKDWNCIAKSVHKLKSAALYSGSMRLNQISHELESTCKEEGASEAVLESLYLTLLQVMRATSAAAKKLIQHLERDESVLLAKVDRGH